MQPQIPCSPIFLKSTPFGAGPVAGRDVACLRISRGLFISLAASLRRDEP